MKSLIASITILGVLGLAVGTGAGAADIGVTVTPNVIISISVSETDVGYGVVDVPSVDNVPTAPSADVIIAVENTGNTSENFLINGANATGTTKNWTIVDGVVGGATTFNYNHKFIDCGSSATCTSPAAVNNMTTTPESLAAAVAPTSTEYFRLRLSTPTETGGDVTVHTTTVTVTAVAS